MKYQITMLLLKPILRVGKHDISKQSCPFGGETFLQEHRRLDRIFFFFDGCHGKLRVEAFVFCLRLLIINIKREMYDTLLASS